MPDKNPLEQVFDDLAKKIKPKKAEDVELTADFATETEVDDGDDVLLSGRLFHVGEYKDQAFSMTPVELHAAIQAFVGPVPMNLHHQSSLFGNADLRGAFGQIEEVWPDDTGEWMMAKARKPKWLHEIMPATKVSAEFNRISKSLQAAAWTHDPIIPEAQLVAAFAKHNTATGQYAVQRIHDVATQAGAICNKPAAMASRHENSAIQQTHDIAVQHGAKCEDQNGQTMPMFSHPPNRRKKMGLKELLLGTAKAQDADADEAEIKKEIDALFSRESDPAVAEMAAKLKAAEDKAALLETAQTQHAANFARMESESRQSAAATFAKDQVIAGRISPAAQVPLEALTVRILEADTAAKFADGEKSNTALLKEVLDALESDFKIFTKNTVGDDAGPFAALFAETMTKGVNGEVEAREDVLKRMRAATPAGRQIEHDKQNGNHA